MAPPSHSTSAKAKVGRYTLDTQVETGPLGPLWSGHVASGPDAGAAVLVRRVDAMSSIFGEGVDELAEAALWAMRLGDDRLVAAIDVVRDADDLSVVSPSVDGVLLRTVLRGGAARGYPIAESVAVRVALDALEQLAVLHTHAGPIEGAYVFGGVTPDSLFIGRDGRARLFDLGISAAAARTLTIGLRLERAGYFAPEQLDGRCDAASDIFGVGLMLWEMLVARRPYRASTFQALAKKVRDAKLPHLARLVRPGSSPVILPLAEVIGHALERDTARRFAHPQEFAAALCATVEPATHQEVAVILGLLRNSTLRPKQPPGDGGKRRQPADTVPYEAEAPAFAEDEMLEELDRKTPRDSLLTVDFEH